jgi:hypothetical protein
MTETKVAQAMRTIADEVAVPSLPADLWRRGRRRHRRRLATTAAVAAALAVVSFSLVRGQPHRVAPADSPPRVPSTVYAPLPFQRTVQQDPAGPAALIVTGEGAFRGSDAFGGYEGRTVVVSRDGRYRLVNGVGEVEAGQDAHLSPDGRYLAVAGAVDGVEDASFDATSLVDLTTGQVRVFDGGSPTAWSPDGQHLLVHGDHALTLVDIRSGTNRLLRKLSAQTPADAQVAVSPDGTRLAIQHAAKLDVIDLATGTQAASVSLGPFLRLAGPGAWTPDGRIAIWDPGGSCAESCDWNLVEATSRLAYVDLSSGDAQNGPAVDEVTSRAPRLLGWQPDGSPIVETFRENLGPQVVALRPGGGQSLLIDMPSQAHHVDIAGNLLSDGRFGAPPPSLGDRVLDWLAGIVPRLLQLCGVIVVVAAIIWYRRRRRA